MMNIMTNRPIYLRFDVWLVSLDPTIGREIKKTCPCIIISPDEIFQLSILIIAPLTSKGFEYPTRVKCQFQDKSGLILLDQLRSVDKRRLVKKLGVLDVQTQQKICVTLQEMFAFDSTYGIVYSQSKDIKKC
jgi:mRNA interferase MazF